MNDIPSFVERLGPLLIALVIACGFFSVGTDILAKRLRKRRRENEKKRGAKR
jgi:ribose 1,5-bisphosphokinase PhnN